MANEEYDPTTDDTTTAVAEPPAQEEWPGTPEAPVPRSRRELVHEGIKATGASPVAQAAFMGDIEQESNFNPRAVSDHGTSVGLFQTGRPMYGNYRRDAAPSNEEEDLYLQPQYVIDQWKKRHPDRWEAMQNAPNAAEAEYIYRTTPGWGYGIAGKRYQHAMDYQRTLGVRDLDTGVRNLDTQENWPGTPESATATAEPTQTEPQQPLDPAVTPPEDVFLQGVLKKHLAQGAARGVYPKAEAVPEAFGQPTTPPDQNWPGAASPADVYGQFGIPDTVAQQDAERARAAQRTGATPEGEPGYDQSPMPPEMVDTLKDVWKSGVREVSKGAAIANPIVGTLEAIPQTRFIAEGIKQGVGELGAGFVGDTDNLALIAASEGLGVLPVGAGLAGRAVSGYFAYQMASQMPELWQQFKDAPDAQTKIAVATKGIGQLVMIGQAGMHAAGPGIRGELAAEGKAREDDAAAKQFRQGYEEGQQEEPPIGPAPNEKNLPDWARQELIRRGQDPNRPFNDWDIQNPSIRAAIQADPTLTQEEKDSLLKTGDYPKKVESITAEAPTFKGEQSPLFDQFSQYMRQVQPQTGTGKPTFAEWQRGQRKGSIGRPDEPVVPETGPEDRGTNMLDEIRNANADTTAKVQALFASPAQGGHQFTREQAADLRRQAWDQAKPEPAPEPGPDLTQPVAEIPDDALHGQIADLKGQLAQVPESELGGNRAGTLRMRVYLLEKELRDRGGPIAPRVIPGGMKFQYNPVGPEAGGTRMAAIENTYLAAEAAEKALPGVPLKEIRLVNITDDRAGKPEDRPVVAQRFYRRGDAAGKAAISKEFPLSQDFGHGESGVNPYQPRKGDVPRYKEWKAGRQPPPEPPPAPDLETLPPDVNVTGHGPIERLRDQAIKDLGLRNWARGSNFSKDDDADIQSKMVQIAMAHPKFKELFEQREGRWFHKRTGQPILGPRTASMEGWETAQPTPDVTNAPAALPVTGFQTSSGSHYEVHDDGTTSRNKAPRKPDIADYGAKPRSAKTVYVTPENMRHLGMPQSGWRMIDHGDGTMSLATLHQGQVGIPATSRNIPVHDTPALGLHPLELWDKSQVKGQDAYAKAHMGNDITTLGGAKPKAPLPPTPRELQSGASREQVQADLAAGRTVNAFDVFGHKLEDELPGGYQREGDNFAKTAQPSSKGHYPNYNGVFDHGAADDYVQQTVGKLAWQRNRIHVMQLQDGNWIYSTESGLSGGGHGMSEKFGTYETSDEAWEAAIKEMKSGAESLLARPDVGKSQAGIAKKTLKWLEDVVTRHIQMPTERFNKLYDKVVAEEEAKAEPEKPEPTPFVAPHPREMSHIALNQELDRLDKSDVAISKQLTAAGRGKEMPSEIRTKSDLLSRHFTQVLDRKKALIDEAARRLGGVRPSLDRLPVGKYAGRVPRDLIPPDKKGTNAPAPAGKPLVPGQSAPSTLPVTPTLKPELKKAVTDLSKQKKVDPAANNTLKVQKDYLMAAIDNAIRTAPDQLEHPPTPDHIVADQEAVTKAAADRQTKPYDGNAALKADQEQQDALRPQLDKYGMDEYKIVTQPYEKGAFVRKERAPNHQDLMAELDRRIEEARRNAFPKIVIEVPEDGTFTIANSKEALKEFKDRAKDFPSTQAKPKQPAKAAMKSTIPAIGKPKTTEDHAKLAGLAASKDETRANLQQVFSDGKRVMATDGRRFVVIDHAGPKNTLLDPKSGKPVGKAELASEKRTNYNEHFPDPSIPRPDPKTHKKVATVDTAEAAKLVKQAQQLKPESGGEQQPVGIWVDKNGKLGITTNNPGVGSFSGGSAEGKTAKKLVTVDANYLADGLKIARGLGHEKVDLHAQDNDHPMTLKAPGLEYILMPMRDDSGKGGRFEGAPAPTEPIEPPKPEGLTDGEKIRLAELAKKGLNNFTPAEERLWNKLLDKQDAAKEGDTPGAAGMTAAWEKEAGTIPGERGLTDAEEEELDSFYDKNGELKNLTKAQQLRYQDLTDRLDAAQEAGTEEHGFGGGRSGGKSRQGFQAGPTNVPEQEKATMVERLAGSPLNPIGIVKSLLSAVAPGARGPKFLEAANELGRHLGRMHRRGEITMSELKGPEMLFTKAGADRTDVPLADNIGMKFASDMSMGRPIDPQFQKAWDTVDKLLKGKLYALHAAGAGLKTLREHYFPGMWDQRSRMAFNAAVEEAIAQGVIDEKANLNRVTPEQEAWIKDRVDRHYERGTGNTDKDMIGYLSRNPMRGRESFRKEKVFEDTLQAIRLGLRPVSANPISLMKLKFAEIDRSIMANEYFQALKNKGLLQIMSPWEKIPEGWQKVPDPYGQIIGPPTVTIKEWLDRGVYDGLEKALTNIGGYHIRKIGIGGKRLGYAQSAAGGQFSGGKTVTRFGTETSVLAHEVGHQLDFKFGLWDTLVRGAEGVGKRGEVTKEASQQARATIQKELRGIADLTGRGAYARGQKEKMAQVLEAYIHAPDMMKEVAPTVYSKFDEFVKSTPQISHLADMRPGLALKQLEAQKYVGMPIMGVRVIPSEHAIIMDNYLSKSLYNSPYVGALYKGWMGAANSINQSQLGMGSAFHATFTLADAVTSNFANILKDGYGVMAGSRTAEDLVRTTGRALGTIVRTPYLGDKVLNAWRNSEPSMDARIVQVVKAAELAGGGFELQKGMETEQWGKMMKDWYSGRKATAILRSPVAVTEALAYPIMKFWVPRLKAGVFADMAWRIIEQNPGKTLEELTPEFRQAWNRVDARLGQVQYDRLFMRNAAKNGLQALIRAPGWTGGTIVELGGALPDAAKFVGDWIKTGHPPRELPDRVAYTMALLMGTVVTNSLLTYAFTGQRPHGLDFWAFRDGNTDEFGNPTRLMLPTYMKDILSYIKHPATTLGNKLHPFLSVANDVLLQNKDYYGTEIRHPDDPWYQQAGQVGKYLLKSYEPFWWRGATKQYQQAGGAVTTPAVLSYFGIMPSPRSLTQTAAEEEAAARVRAHLPQGARTEAQAEHSQNVKDTVRDVQLKRTTIQQALRSGRISQSDVKNVQFQVQSPALTRAIAHLGPEDSMAIWKKADPAERQQIRQLVINKIQHSKTLTKDRQRELFHMMNQ